MKPISKHRRLYFSLGMVLILLVGGVGGILYYGKTHEAAESAAAKTGAKDGSEETTGEEAKEATAEGNEENESESEGTKEAKKNGGGKEKTPIPVSVTEIGTGTVSTYISSTANLVAEDDVEILAEAEGRLATLRAEEGDRVDRGEVLASLVQDDEEIALKKAQLKAKNALMAYERAVKMVDEELVSREEFDRITMEHEIAKQELAEAEWKLEKTMIRAPFSGTVTQRNTKLGQHVRVGDVLFSVADFDPLIARIYLPERDMIGLREGREVRITLKADESNQFAGRIRQISPVVDTATGTVKVTIEANDSPPVVRPGAFVTIDIVRQTRDAAVILPRQAVIRELKEAYVFIAKGEVAEKRRVALGLEEEDRIEAVSGVDPGEQVIVAGQGGLKNGTTIKVIPVSEASDLGARADDPYRG